MPAPSQTTTSDGRAVPAGRGAHPAGDLALAGLPVERALARDDEGWRDYNGGGMHDPGDVTGGHYDHLHVTVRVGA